MVLIVLSIVLETNHVGILHYFVQKIQDVISIVVIVGRVDICMYNVQTLQIVIWNAMEVLVNVVKLQV